MADEGMRLAAESVSATPFEIPGSAGEFRIQILNEDTSRGVVTSIVHLPPGGRIPAHMHKAGPEMHYVLEGDLIEKGESLGPGSFLTHAPGVVHGPHESQNGARVLTVQQWQSQGGSFDFNIAEDAPAAPSGSRGGEKAQAGAATASTGEPAGDGGGASGGGESPAATAQRQEAEQSLGKGYG
ncbi:MAG: cupin domain-containing protein [Acetobacteraceae bacterium]|nr:cupin domain-containing protein [Acetobacteraceae bacterium]